MQEGTIFFVFTFPKPWPPIQPISLLSHSTDLDRVCLTADPSGKLKLSIIYAGQVIADYTFQPLDIEGDGRSIVSITWSKDIASLRLNGKELKLDINAGEERYTLHTSAVTVDRGYIFPGINPNAGKSEAERLFLATLADIDIKVMEGTRYSLIRAAGLLRQLFLDATPLIHEVNRNYRVRLQFERGEYHTQPPITPDAHWINPDCSSFPKAQTVSISLDAFLKSPCLILQGQTASIADLIKACANVKGGVHLGKVTTTEEKVVIDWDNAIEINGEQPSLLAIAGVCRVVLRSLKPLASAITGK